MSVPFPKARPTLVAMLPLVVWEVPTSAFCEVRWVEVAVGVLWAASPEVPFLEAKVALVTWHCDKKKGKRRCLNKSKGLSKNG